MSEQVEELDYMSDVFINPQSDVAPGLVTTKSIQRKRTVEATCKQHRMPSKSEAESQRRNEGLQKQVGPENKGFDMLIKMGYAPGKGLGKNAEGRAEPISIEVPEQRAGLGLMTAKRERQESRKAALQKVEVLVQHSFRNSMADKFRVSRLQRQLNAARLICQQLDVSQSIMEPFSSYYWPQVSDPDNCARVSCSKRRRADYLRSQSVGRTRQRGLSRAVHHDNEGNDEEGYYMEYDLPHLSDEEDLTSLDADNMHKIEPDTEVTLQEVIAYLRRQHYYCFWCSTHYTDQTDLQSNCPGLEEEDHE